MSVFDGAMQVIGQIVAVVKVFEAGLSGLNLLFTFCVEGDDFFVGTHHG